MSYAEYGANIFLSQKFKIDRLFIRDEELAQVRSGCKLKTYNNCSDIRAWSQNSVENLKYFRDVTETPSNRKIIPIDFLLDMIKEFGSKSEIHYLHRELEKYKSLELTREQEEILKEWNFEGRSSINSECYSKQSVSTNPEIRSESIDQGASTKNNPTEQNQLSRTDDVSTENELKLESSSFSHQFSKSVISSQDSYKTQENETEDENSVSTSTVRRSDSDSDDDDDNDDDSATESYEKSESQDDISWSCSSQTKDTIIKNEAMLISLENELKKKNIELEELKEMNENLLMSIRTRETMIGQLQKDLKTLNVDMNQLMTQHNSDLKQWKIESSSLIDQLQSKLEERNRLCREQQEEIKMLRTSYNGDRLRIERDSLTKKLDDITKLMRNAGFEAGLEGIETLLRERRELIDANYKLNDSERHLSLRCLDREKEIEKLSRLINSTCVKYENQLSHKNHIIVELKTELKNKTVTIKAYEDEMASIKQESEEFVNEYCIHDDQECDDALATFLKKSLDGINKFSEAAKEAGNATEEWFKNSEKEKTLYKEKLQAQNDEIKRLHELNSELQKKTSIINKVKKTNSEMELKLVHLNKKHHDLTNDIQSLHNKLSSRNDKILLLKHEKGILLSKVDNSEAKVAEKDLRIAALKEENAKISAVLKEHEKKVSSVLKEMNFLRTENESVHQIAHLEEEIQKFELNQRNNEETIKNLREELKNYQNSNMALEKDLRNKLNENETLKIKISGIREQLKDSMTRNNSFSQLDIIRGSLETFKKRFDWLSGESAEKTDNDQSARKIQGSNKEVLADDHNELENCRNDTDRKGDMINLEADEKIKYQDNKRDVKIDEERIKSLIREKEELTVQMNNERVAHKNTLLNVKQSYEEKLRIYIEDHNQSVMRLQEQYLQSEKKIGNNQQITDPAEIIINGKSQLHIVRSRHIFPKETIVDDSRVSKLYAQNDMNFSLYTDDNKAEQRYALSFRNNGGEESIKPEADKHIKAAHDSPCKVFIGHCSSIRNTTKRRNI